MPEPEATPLQLLAQRYRDHNEIEAASLIDLYNDPSASWVLDYYQPQIPLNIMRGTDTAAPRTLHILLPSTRLSSATGGPNTAYVIGALLAEHKISINFVSTDLTIDKDLTGIHDHIRTLTGVDPAETGMQFFDATDRSIPLVVQPQDVLLATACWTAAQAKCAIAITGAKNFYYLIQDYEPLLYCSSENYAGAVESYSYPHLPIVNTQLLHNHLTQERIGKFADATFAREAMVFQPAVDKALYYPEPVKHDRAKKRLIFYARPTAARRNLFGLGVVALRAAIADGLFGADWEFLGMGEAFEELGLGSGHTLVHAPWMNLTQYGEFIRQSDILLCPMLSPHPSYPILEMASAARPVVTTVFMSKSADALAEVSTNIIGVEPNVDDMVAGLRTAKAMIERATTAPISYPSTWRQSFETIIPRMLQDLRRHDTTRFRQAPDP